jgi:cysteine synthase
MKPFEFPKLIIEEHEGFHVVRDDLLEGGSKRRFVDRMMRDEIENGIEEFVYGGCPANGYAQLSLTLQANAYGKKAIFFMAQRSMQNLHPYQQQALDYGADIRWVPNGMLQVTKARAREYVAEDPKKRILLPLGLEHPKVLEDIRELAKDIEIVYNIKISEIWSVGSSGTLIKMFM